MKKKDSLHILNANFEKELEGKIYSLESFFQSQELFYQMQFFPLFYAQKEDFILVTEKPQEDYFLHLKKKYPSVLPHLNLKGLICLGDKLPKNIHSLKSWAPSLYLKNWAKKNKIELEQAPWDIVKTVNNKFFSHKHCPRLKESCAFYTIKELEDYLKKQKDKIVIKTCFGTAGSGHMLVNPQKGLIQHQRHQLQQQCLKKYPILVEPWKKRILDFSTQWKINKDKNISYLGSTILLNTPKGAYRGNLVGDEKIIFRSFLPFLEEQKTFSQDALKKMAQIGYFGYVGIDAMIYKEKNKSLLHPIVEINARKTGGLFCLMLQKKFSPEKCLRLLITKNQKKEHSLVPGYYFNKMKKKEIFPLHIHIDHKLVFPCNA